MKKSMQYVQKLKKFNNKNKGKDQRNNSNKEKYKIITFNSSAKI